MLETSGPSLHRQSNPRWLRRRVPLALALGGVMLGEPALGTTRAALANADATEESKAVLLDVVNLRLDIAVEGRRVGRINRLVAFDTTTVMALEAGQRHEVTVLVHRVDDGDQLEVTVAYRRDDESMIQRRTVQTTADRLEVVRNRDARLRLKMYETKVPPSELPPARPRLEYEQGSDDPLAGL
ncbi:MAG: hypothetical protein AAF799_19780 [Myxococcota bacterium]